VLVVLDTHTWIWWLDRPEKLGKGAARTLRKATRVGIAAISPWEIAMKVRIGKLRLDRSAEAWVQAGLHADPRVELLPLGASAAVEAGSLPWDHGDPADRLIVATARAHGAVLVTSDAAIHESGLVRCVWD